MNATRENARDAVNALSAFFNEVPHATDDDPRLQFLYAFLESAERVLPKAVCHCGEYMDAHTQASNHTAVEMEEG